jgi:hypothetical protein
VVGAVLEAGSLEHLGRTDIAGDHVDAATAGLDRVALDDLGVCERPPTRLRLRKGHGGSVSGKLLL